MIIDEKVLAQAFIDGKAQLEAHERVPFFIVTDISQVNEELVVGNYYTETVLGVTYAKMGSNHKNMDGTFSGAEPTYSSKMALEVQRQWVEALGVENMVNWQELQRLRGLEAMTPIEYREYVREQLEAESKPGGFDFTCELKGKTLHYHIDDSDRIDLIGQMMMGLPEYEVHDIKRENNDTYNQEEVGVIMGTLAAVTRAHKYPIDAKIKALYELPEGFTNADVDTIYKGV